MKLKSSASHPHLITEFGVGLEAKLVRCIPLLFVNAQYLNSFKHELTYYYRSFHSTYSFFVEFDLESTS